VAGVKVLKLKLPDLLFILLLIISSAFQIKSQTLAESAETIRKKYEIPELGYAVISSEAILEIQTLGFKRVNSTIVAQPQDRFHLGSNTKAITGFIAALLVRQNKIAWQTKFFDLFPNLKAHSRRAYDDLTLQDLLTFRARLPPYTYTNPLPKKFKGDAANQRFQLAKWFLRQPPNDTKDELKLTNAGYVLAGLMLERAAGKSYKELVGDLGATLKINFAFDYPNLSDTAQPWGHDIDLKPQPPKSHDKLNWLLAAGNINVSLPDYAKFIQTQLRGLAGKSDLLTQEEFEFLHYGLPEFAVGWFWKMNERQQQVSFNVGNAGAFITEVYVVKDADRAYILFTNSATDRTSEGLKVLLESLMKKYGN
jgi:CubicO group peptidase (beta-lactamase class C family)